MAVVSQAWQPQHLPGFLSSGIRAVEPETVQGTASTGAHRVLAGRSSVPFRGQSLLWAIARNLGFSTLIQVPPLLGTGAQAMSGGHHVETPWHERGNNGNG